MDHGNLNKLLGTLTSSGTQVGGEAFQGFTSKSAVAELGPVDTRICCVASQDMELDDTERRIFPPQGTKIPLHVPCSIT